jgi:biopolymer transport protein ExbB
MPESSSFGFNHFLFQTDYVGLFVLLVLAVMSILTWCVIVLKIGQNWLIRSHSKTFLAAFRRSVINPGDAKWLLTQEASNNPFARLLDEGLESCQWLKDAREEANEPHEGFALAAPDDFVSAALHRGVAFESGKLENGLTVLASIASSAPFVGLFGTVWGIYHALLAIGLSGQASLDKVAGPVGEALIMTACGLAVAIPAVLAYNAFTRFNRNLISTLESYAHEVFGFLGLGCMHQRRTASPKRAAHAIPSNATLNVAAMPVAAVPGAEGAR